MEEAHGTTSDVVFYAYGSEGMTGPLTLASGKDKKHFQAGQTDNFTVGSVFLNKICQNDTGQAWDLAFETE